MLSLSFVRGKERKRERARRKDINAKDAHSGEKKMAKLGFSFVLSGGLQVGREYLS